MASSFLSLERSYADFLVGSGLSARTVDIYNRRIDSAILWFAERGVVLADASAAELAEWGSQLAPSTSTRRQARSAVTHYLEWLNRPTRIVKAIRVLFPGLRGRVHVHPGTVWGWVRQMGQQVGIPDLRPHQLRHTAIATLHDATGDLRTASEFARHRRIETTMVYSRTPEATLRKAVDQLRY